MQDAVRAVCRFRTKGGKTLKGNAERTARCLMIQGTASHSGKSVIAAAFCRIFTQDGFRVAPFKSQNMSLNSFVTSDGGEMGRAQVMQAQAAGVEHHTDMNPILLKPLSDCVAQVILHGRPIGNMDAMEYDGRKLDFLPEVVSALNRLRGAFDIVVLEGAGSPAEVNLMDTDIVNMRMAEAAEAPVLLVGDIDKGGVFGSLLGTVELLPHEHRSLVAGFIINKFRGDRRLLEPGPEILERKTGIPVLGVVPFIHQLGIDEEDTVPLETLRAERNGEEGPVIDIAVLHLPHISNSTDFDALGREPGVLLRYVKYPENLMEPDAVIIPGTKNTISDLHFLRRCGMAERILKLAGDGVPLIGICGGYQMLGCGIDDTHGVETDHERVEGLALLPGQTSLEKDKQTCQVEVRVHASIPILGLVPGMRELTGYEIHTGSTTAVEGSAPLCIIRRGSTTVDIPEGSLSESGLVFGTYVHGLFDNPHVRRGLVGFLLGRKGLERQMSPLTEIDRFREERFDNLASAVRASADMSRIYDILQLD